MCLESLTSGYGEKQVVNSITANFNSGEFTAILGLNGSGKTTLLKTICGIIKPKFGSVFINGQDSRSLSRKQLAQQVSLIPQRHSPQIGMEVLDVILMGRNPYLGLLEFPSKEDREKAMEIGVKLGIEKMLGEDFENLSEGQKQLVILARTLLQNTSVLLMDEPDSALDYRNKHAVLSKVKNLVVTEDKIGVITTHDPNFAFRYCDRVVLLENGEIIGDYYVKEEAVGEIEEGIKRLYGEVGLIFHEGYFLMVQR